MGSVVPSNESQIVQGGRPDPLDFRRARPVGGLFEPGAYDAVDPTVVLIPIAGAFLIRLRGKFTGGGTLSFAYRRNPPDQATAYSAALSPAHADEVVVANAEFLVDIAPGGEGYLAITWTPVGAGNVTFFDQMQQ